MANILPIDQARITGAPRTPRKRKRRWLRISLWCCGQPACARAAGCVRRRAVAALGGKGRAAGAGWRRARRRPFGAGNGAARRAWRSAHRGGHAGRPVCRAGLRDRAGPPVADGCLPPQRQRRTGGDHGPVAGGARQGAARAADSATPRSASMRICPRPIARASTTMRAA